MTNEQQQDREWMQQFGQDAPEKPTIPSLEIRKLRAKLILEEALETAKALGFDIDEGSLVEDMMSIATIIEPNLTQIADGCEDLKVVTEGTLVACGLVEQVNKQVAVGVITPGLPAKISYEVERKEDPLFNEVMRSNFSKRWSRDELQKELNGMIGAFVIGETKEINGLFITFSERHGNNPHSSEKVFVVKDKDGKVIKSPSYSPANLQPIIDEMSK